jgi:RNA polymerase sigma factor (TIGR02999 family)
VSPEPRQLTVLLREWTAGNRDAFGEITSAVYGELRKLAAAKLRRERTGHTLQPTALIHETYLRLIDHEQETWQNRAHFFSVASQIMREILVDHARRYGSAKRGGGRAKVSFNEAISFAPERAPMLLALDDALRELASFDERKSRLIELKYFGGLQVEEIGEVLGVSRSTVMRDSRMAEAWLYHYLTS